MPASVISINNYLDPAYGHCAFGRRRKSMLVFNIAHARVRHISRTRWDANALVILARSQFQLYSWHSQMVNMLCSTRSSLLHRTTDNIYSTVSTTIYFFRMQIVFPPFRRLTDGMRIEFRPPVCADQIECPRMHIKPLA